jgi:hypothetical protein
MYIHPASYRRARSYKPTHVLNSAGVTGRPNVDWCEDNKKETIRANVIGYGNSTPMHAFNCYAPRVCALRYQRRFIL